MSFVHLTIAADNSNAEALRIQDELGMQMVEVKLASSRIARYLSTVEDLDGVIASSEKLSAVSESFAAEIMALSSIFTL